MDLYMTEYKKQNYKNGEWFDEYSTEYIFIVIAKDYEEAKKRTEIALAKVNKHAYENTRYILKTEPKPIEAMSIAKNNLFGTHINGIWE